MYSCFWKDKVAIYADYRDVDFINQGYESVYEKKSEIIWNAWKDVLIDALKVWKWGFVKSKKVWNQIKIWTLTSLINEIYSKVTNVVTCDMKNSIQLGTEEIYVSFDKITMTMTLSAQESVPRVWGDTSAAPLLHVHSLLSTGPWAQEQRGLHRQWEDTEGMCLLLKTLFNIVEDWF